MNKFIAIIFFVLIIGAFNSCERKQAQQEATVPAEMVMVENQANTLTTMPGMQAGGEQAAMATTESMAPSAEQVQGTAVEMAGEFMKPASKEIQQALKNVGLYQGNVDGDIGPKTTAAIKEFQQNNGLTADGKVGRKTWAKLAPYLTAAPSAEAPASQVTVTGD